MDRKNQNINYTEYAIEWMKAHETPLPPDQQVALESIPTFVIQIMGS